MLQPKNREFLIASYTSLTGQEIAFLCHSSIEKKLGLIYFQNVLSESNIHILRYARIWDRKWNFCHITTSNRYRCEPWNNLFILL